MLRKIKNILPNSLKHFVKEVFPEKMYGRLSYSQEGEDLILMRMFEGKKSGFYVDVGAHHPFRFSNTYIFYKRGWRGINVDPMPGLKRRFDKYRPRDITIEKGVSNKRGALKYHVFNEGALNTFDEKIAEDRVKLPRWELKDIIEISCVRLEDILDEYLPDEINEISMLSVDAEGYDLSVLESNDWCKYRPLIVVVECLESSLETIYDDPVVKFMRAKGYDLFSKMYHSIVFKRNNSGC